MTNEQLKTASSAIREKARALDKALNAAIAEFRADTGCEIPIAEMVPTKDSYVLKFKVTIE